MLMTEWNWDDALAVRYDEGREEGIEIGEQRGEQRGVEKERKSFAELLKSGKSIEELQKIYT